MDVSSGMARRSWDSTGLEVQNFRRLAVASLATNSSSLQMSYSNISILIKPAQVNSH